MSSEIVVSIEMPEAFQPLFEPHRYKSFYGGRGGAKSWAYADALLVTGINEVKRILCTREYQNTIADSVHRLLSDRIQYYKLGHHYDIQKQLIKGANGTEIIFKGLHHNINEIKSMEGIDIVWVEEAQSLSEDSWKVLIPTIRKDGSEIWLSWNTGEAKDPTYQRFVTSPPDDCVSIKVGWRDNPFFPETLNKERLYCKRTDKESYDHIWEGMPYKINEALVFKGKFVIDEFEAPSDVLLKYGADWGFANDPTCMVRSYRIGSHLYIEHEAYGVGVELDEIPDLFDTVPGSRSHLIKADSARPDTISHVRRKGFHIEPTLKWPSGVGKKGSVKEGIEFLRTFEVIHIHQRCKHAQQEFKSYSYKTDRKTNEILPILIDANNHIIDSLRYSYDKDIKGGFDWGAFLGES